MCACSGGDPSPIQTRSPAASEAIAQARAELELVAPTDQHGAGRQFDHGDFLADSTSPQADDTGDFFGRLSTLFGPIADHVYTVRPKTTGSVITVSVANGLAYMAPRDSDDVACHARIAADPVLAAGQPIAGPGKAFDDQLPAPQSMAFLLDRAEHAAPGTEADLHALELYVAHPDELKMQRPRVYQRFASAAATKKEHDGMQAMAERPGAGC